MNTQFKKEKKIVCSMDVKKYNHISCSLHCHKHGRQMNSVSNCGGGGGGGEWKQI